MNCPTCDVDMKEIETLYYLCEVCDSMYRVREMAGKKPHLMRLRD